jgi:polyferredoxin
MGIDIRNGQQLACITCALCIDACDDVMDKIGKPRGLIDYIALTDETRERAGEPPRNIWTHILRPRTILYTALWSLVGIGLTAALFMRQEIDITVAPVRNPTFVTLSDGSIRNTYEVRIRNMNLEARAFHLSLTADVPLTIEVEGHPDLTVEAPANQMVLQRVYVIAAPDSPAARAHRTEFRLWVEDLQSTDRAYKDTVFNGKGE